MMIDHLKVLLQRRGGVAKTNRFDILMSLPLGIQIADRGRDLSLLCESTMLPGKQITTMEYSLYEHLKKIPTGHIYEDVSFTFNLTNDYYVKDVFEQWQNKIIDKERFLLNYVSDYQTDIHIRQLDEQDSPVWTTTLRNAYPITVNPIQLDNTSDSSIQKLSVTFAYSETR